MERGRTGLCQSRDFSGENGDSCKAVHACLGVCNRENVKKSQVVLRGASLGRIHLAFVFDKSQVHPPICSCVSRCPKNRACAVKVPARLSRKGIAWLFTRRRKRVCSGHQNFFLSWMPSHCSVDSRRSRPSASSPRRLGTLAGQHKLLMTFLWRLHILGAPFALFEHRSRLRATIQKIGVVFS